MSNYVLYQSNLKLKNTPRADFGADVLVAIASNCGAVVVADADADVFFVDMLEELQKVGIKIALY